MATDGTNLQKIKAFNQKAGAAGAQIPTPQNPVTPVVSPSARMSVNDIQLLMADPATLSKEEILRRQALATKENLRIAEEEHKKLEQKAREDAIKRRDAQEVLKGQAVNIGANVADRSAPVGNWLASKPQPGGIAGVLLLIGVFLLAIVPTAPTGKTRLNLMWLTLTGKTHIDYSKTGQGTAQATGQAPPIINPGQSTVQPPTDTSQSATQPTVQPIQNYNQAMSGVIDGLWNL